jgi:hypothetical protein
MRKRMNTSAQAHDREFQVSSRAMLHYLRSKERSMASSLNRTGESRPRVYEGHRTRELGPSESSDTGSDVVGGPGLGFIDLLHLDRGTTSDPDRGGQTAGADLGDSDLDSDSDAAGTGENIAAGRDPLRINRDIRPDRIVTDPDASATDEAPADEDSGLTTPRREGSSGTEDRETPSIDRPPRFPKGGDIPVADRGEQDDT